jgi:hypothetical protein
VRCLWLLAVGVGDYDEAAMNTIILWYRQHGLQRCDFVLGDSGL